MYFALTYNNKIFSLLAFTSGFWFWQELSRQKFKKLTDFADFIGLYQFYVTLTSLRAYNNGLNCFQYSIKFCNVQNNDVASQKNRTFVTVISNAT